MKQGRVYLVGAGCGRADLLTLRGKQRLEGCDAVVYDDLIDPAILDFTPQSAQRIYMGKRSGCHSAPQADISAKLVALAEQGMAVVRLKGGDPFVFGRGGEEIMALQQADIPFEEVPGITSAIAIPAGAGIPVTHRGLSRSLHIITGHTADTPDGLPADLPQLAATSGTLVFLMGLGHLELIARRLMEYGRPPDTPAAVISGGNSPAPAAVRATLADIARKARDVQPPAVIVMGDVAALDLSPTIPAPLAGVRVGVTGTKRITGRLTAALTALGAQVRQVGRSIVAERPVSLDFLTRPGPKWAVLTSPNGVEVLFRQMRAQSIDLRSLHSCRFAAIGPATAHALAQHGIFADLCPKEHTSAALAQALIEQATPEEELFLLRSARGAPVLKQLPEQRGFTVRDIPLYDALPDPDCAGKPEGLDFIIFCSAAGVEYFFRRYGKLPEGAVPVCIGPVTAGAVQRYTAAHLLTAEDTTVEAIVQAILKHP